MTPNQKKALAVPADMLLSEDMLEAVPRTIDKILDKRQ